MSNANQLQLRCITQAQESLEARGIDSNKPGYRTAGYLMGEVALHGFGMRVTQFDVDHWVGTQGIMRSLDNLVDDYGVTDVSEPLQMLVDGEGIDGHVSNAEAELFAGLIDVYDLPRRERQLRGLRSLPFHEQKRRGSTNPHGYITAVLHEAVTYSDLVSTVRKSSDADHDSQIMNRVDQWISNFIVAGYFVDSIADINDDYTSGTFPVKPNMTARLAMAKVAITAGAPTLFNMPIRSSPRIATLFKAYT